MGAQEGPEEHQEEAEAKSGLRKVPVAHCHLCPSLASPGLLSLSLEHCNQLL